MDSIDTSKNSSMKAFNFNFTQAVLILEEHKNKSDLMFEGSSKRAIVAGYIALIVAGIFTNLVVSVVIVANSRLRVARNLLVVNLSLSDLMLCIFCMPFTLVDLLTRGWSLGKFLCRCVPFVQGITIFVSSATVSAIAIDRQYVIINFQGNCNRGGDGGGGNMLLYTSLVWCFSVLMALPIIFSMAVTSVTVQGVVLYEKCIERWPSTHAKALYSVLILAAQFVAPSAVLAVTHLRIKAHLNGRVRLHGASPRTRRELRRNGRATLVLSFISVVFACSWLPWNAFNIAADFGLLAGTAPDAFYLAFGLCHLLAMSSSVSNPILYGWFNGNVRRELRRIRVSAMQNVLGKRAVVTKSEPPSNGTALCDNTYIRCSARRDLQESQL